MYVLGAAVTAVVTPLRIVGVAKAGARAPAASTRAETFHFCSLVLAITIATSRDRAYFKVI